MNELLKKKHSLFFSFSLMYYAGFACIHFLNFTPKSCGKSLYECQHNFRWLKLDYFNFIHKYGKPGKILLLKVSFVLCGFEVIQLNELHCDVSILLTVRVLQD